MSRVAAKIARITAPALIRVAVYARQSVEDSRSEFGSIDAQRESVEAYVKSQAGLGWRVLPERFEDAGFSGSNIQRPAFRRLMALVNAGEVDVVATYRLDRVSRSLADFVGIMKTFRDHNVDFVSVTQGFSTSTSVGRMTINLLATFAEFEREVISERTKDKVCAARRKGRFTGGRPPLGYDVHDSKLVVNDAEADQVHAIFDTFTHLGSVMATVVAVNARGIRTKSWTTQEGRVVAPRPFDKTTLRSMLTNPVYVGMVRLGAEAYEGTHAAIIARTQFEAVANALDAQPRRGAVVSATGEGRLLQGLLHCEVCGWAMTPTSTQRGARKHVYYACSLLVKRGASACPDSRVSAPEIERGVVERIRHIGRDPELVEATIAAARHDLAARAPESEAEAKRHDAELARVGKQRRNLVDAVAQGGAGAETLMARVGELDAEIAAITERVRVARDERDRLDHTRLDEALLRHALEEFDGLWTELVPRERSQVLGALVESVSYDGRNGQVQIEFRT